MNAQVFPTFVADLLFDLPAEQYHQRVLGEVSNSGVKQALRSAAHYKAWVEATDEHDTPTFAFGRAFHAALLEPARFAQDWSVQPDFGDLRTKAARESRDAWKAEHPNVTTLPQEDMERIHAMIAAVLAHPWARRAVRDGHSEVTLRWSDDTTGLPCKARADYYVDGKAPFVLDVKTTLDASPEAFARDIAKYGYHIQHAHYADGFRVLGRPLRNYLLLAVEKEPPYAVAMYYIDAEAEQRGYDLRARGIEHIAACLKSGVWPAYTNDITRLSLPRWALND